MTQREFDARRCSVLRAATRGISGYAAGAPSACSRPRATVPPLRRGYRSALGREAPPPSAWLVISLRSSARAREGARMTWKRRSLPSTTSAFSIVAFSIVRSQAESTGTTSRGSFCAGRESPPGVPTRWPRRRLARVTDRCILEAVRQREDTSRLMGAIRTACTLVRDPAF